MNLGSSDAVCVLKTLPAEAERKPKVTGRLTAESREDMLQQQLEMLLDERDELRSQLAKTSAQLRQGAKVCLGALTQQEHRYQGG